MLFFRKTQGLDSSTMRQIAAEAGVSWEHQKIVHHGHAIGFGDGLKDDKDEIQDAAENLLGYRPITTEPPESDESDE